ncbi:MAG TPA: hypothetical protein VIF43_02325 [Patescibacteria group bacterium]|jgi:hypothetical protein
METNVKTDIERGAMEGRAGAEAPVFDGHPRTDGLREGASVEELRAWTERASGFFGSTPERTREPDDGSDHEWPRYDPADDGLAVGDTAQQGPDDPLEADRALASCEVEPLPYDRFPTFEDLQEDPQPEDKDWKKEARKRYAEILGQTADLDSEEAEAFITEELCLELDRFRFPHDPEWDEAVEGRPRGYKDLKDSEKGNLRTCEEQVQFLVERFQERITEALRNAEWVEGSFQDAQFLEDREFIAALLFRAGAESQAYHHWFKYDNVIEPDDPRHENLAGHYVKYISRQRTGDEAYDEMKKARKRLNDRSARIHEEQRTLLDISKEAKVKIGKKQSVRRIAFDTRYNRKIGLALMRICNPDTIEFFVRAFRLNESGEVPVAIPRDRVAETYAGTPMRVLIEDEETEVGQEGPVFA